jgi:hypothetical protein
MYIGTTFLRAKQDMFTRLSNDSWKIKFASNIPIVHTLRDFTVAEKEDVENSDLKGVRTYFFNAHHHRGLPEFAFGAEGIDHKDYRWVPKRQLNEYFTREYYEALVPALSTR